MAKYDERWKLRRESMIAALALLGLNDLRVDAEAGALVDPATGVSTGKVAKAEVAIFLQEHSRSRRA